MMKTSSPRIFIPMEPCKIITHHSLSSYTQCTIYVLGRILPLPQLEKNITPNTGTHKHNYMPEHVKLIILSFVIKRQSCNDIIHIVFQRSLQYIIEHQTAMAKLIFSCTIFLYSNLLIIAQLKSTLPKCDSVNCQKTQTIHSHCQWETNLFHISNYTLILHHHNTHTLTPTHTIVYMFQ